MSIKTQHGSEQIPEPEHPSVPERLEDLSRPAEQAPVQNSESAENQEERIERLRTEIREHPEMKEQKYLDKVRHKLSAGPDDVGAEEYIELENVRDRIRKIEAALSEYQHGSIIKKAIGLLRARSLKHQWQKCIDRKNILEEKLRENDMSRTLH